MSLLSYKRSIIILIFSEKHNINSSHLSLLDINMKITVVFVFMLCTFAIFMACASHLEEAIPPPPFSKTYVDQAFAEWMLLHEKNYSSTLEFTKRRNLFKKELVHIHEFNKGKKSYTIGLNQFSDLSVEENMTCVLDTHNLLHSSSKREFIMGDGDVPDSYDLRDLDAVTSVKNQGKCGACWAFAVVAAIESLVSFTDHHLISLSPQELIDCTSQRNGCESGFLHSAFDYVTNNDLRSEEHYPYKQEKQTSCLGDKTAGYSIDGYGYISGNEDSDVVRKALLKYTLVASINIGDEFKSYQRGIFSGPCGTIKHAVAIIGYGEESGLKYWLIKNSWGVEWGESGFGRISSENNCGLLSDLLYPHIEDYKQK